MWHFYSHKINNNFLVTEGGLIDVNISIQYTFLNKYYVYLILFFIKIPLKLNYSIIKYMYYLWN